MYLLTSLYQMLYIDPAAATVLLTSITTIVAAVGASAIIIWRKLKKKVKNTLHIDENAGKEVEEDLVITEDEVKTDSQTSVKTEVKAEEAVSEK